jgi:small subunit ribosomal protein S16
VAVKIRLKRMGKIRQPYYRLVVVDSRKKRDGRVIEEIGKYHPKQDPSYIEVVSDRAQYWLGVGAQPTEAVEAILKVTGDWQTFKGLPGTEGTLRTAEPRRDKTEIFNEALKDAANEPKSEAVTRKRAAKKAAQPAAEETPAAEAPAAEAPAKEAPAAEAAAEEAAPAGGGDESSVSTEAAAEADIAEEAPDADAEAAADANAESATDADAKA